MKRNYLVVMPRFVSRIGEGYNFAMGVAYISGALKAAKFNVFTLNLNHVDGEIGAIVRAVIRENNIDVLMTGGLSFQYSSLKAIVDAAKQEGKTVVLGGGIVTGDPAVTMEAFGNVDIGVIGEGEATAIELCETLEQEGDIGVVNGIIYAENGGGGVCNDGAS